MVQITFQVPVLTEGVVKGDRSRKLILGTVPFTAEIEEVDEARTSPLMEAPFEPDGPGEPWTRRLSMINGVPHIDESVYTRTIPTKVKEFGKTVYVPHPFQGISKFIMKQLFLAPRQSVKAMKPDGVGNEVHHGKNITKKIVPLSDFEFVDIDHSKVEQCLEVFKNDLARSVIVDGRFFYQVVDPVIVVQGRSHGYTLAMRWSDEHPFWDRETGDYPPVAIYQVDEVSDLKKCLTSASLKIQFDTGAKLKVFDKSYHADVDTVSMSLQAAIRSMVEEIREMDGYQKILDRLTPRIIQLYQTMVEFLQKCDDPDHDETAAQLIEEVLSLPHDGRCLFGSNVNMAIHEAQLQRWLDRDIRLDVSGKPIQQRKF